MTKKMINYSLFQESIIDPIKPNLSNDIWDNKKSLKSQVKNQILKILYDWMKNLKINDKILGLKLTGSMCGYQYTKESDIDVNVEIDIEKDRAQRIRKILPNGKFLKGTKHPINYFFANIQDKTSITKNSQRAIYDILKNKWIRKPSKSKENPFLLYEKAIEQAISWSRKISLDLEEMRRDVEEYEIYLDFSKFKNFDLTKGKNILEKIKSKEFEIKADYDILKMDFRQLRSFRYEAFSPEKDPFISRVLEFDPENPPHADFSLNNVMYKIIEKFGYIDQLKKAKKDYIEKFPELLEIEDKT